MDSYGQFCPAAQAAEILTRRGMPLVVRELLCGSRRFDDQHSGVPRMSRSLRRADPHGRVARGRPPRAGAERGRSDGGRPLRRHAGGAWKPGRLCGGGYPFRTEDWKTRNSSLFAALQLEKLAMGVILLLIVIVAAFNIISTLVMVVTDKTREIGIMRSMGLRASQVQRVFMLQGVVIGATGSILGGVAGLFLTWLLDRYQFIEIPGDVYFIDRLPVAFDPVDIGVILLASMLISFVATLYPSREAARLLPVEAIRHD